MTKKISLKKTRTCKNCLAYEEEVNYGQRSGYCSLGFETEPAKDYGYQFGKKSMWITLCKPIEMCPKPTTIKEEVECKEIYPKR